jgi:hypothetical protein
MKNAFVTFIFLSFASATVQAKTTRDSSQLMGAATTSAMAAATQGAQTAAATGSAFGKICGPLHPSACVMAALAAYQAGEFVKGRSDTEADCDGLNLNHCHGGNNQPPGGLSDPNAGDSDGTGGTTGGGFVTVPSGQANTFSNGKTAGGTNTLSTANAQLANILNTAAANGVTLDPTTGDITTPNGTFTAAQLSTPEGLAAAGVTPSDLKLADQIAQKVLKDAAKKTRATAVSGGEGFAGGGRRLRASPGFNADDDFKKYLAGMMRKPAAIKNDLQGLAVLHNGEPVGISQGDIFITISNRYNILKQTGVVGQ